MSITAVIKAEDAYDTAYLIERAIPLLAVSADEVERFQVVANALYALANDTDAIVTENTP